MESMIHIGAKVDKEFADNLGDFVKTVFKAGQDTHMEQATIVEALKLADKLGSVKNTSVMNCHLVGEKTVEVE